MGANTNETLPVTQADREAAADLALWRGLPRTHANGIRAGKIDEDFTVQAFALHRLASQPAPLDRPASVQCDACRGEGGTETACPICGGAGRIFALTTAPRDASAVERAARQAVALLDEVNERKASRDLNGIGQALHAKLCTIRATLARALAALSSPGSPVSDVRGEALEEAARVAETFEPTGYMSDRERDYCRQHGEEIAAAIRSLNGEAVR